MQCLTDLGSGTYQVQAPQPSDYTTCTMLVVSPTELQSDIYALSAAQGVQLSIAIGTIWAVAFVFRVLNQQLSSKIGESNE